MQILSCGPDCKDIVSFVNAAHAIPRHVLGSRSTVTTRRRCEIGNSFKRWPHVRGPLSTKQRKWLADICDKLAEVA